MGVVLLVRHGQASFDADDYDVLSPSGWLQSRVLGTWLAERSIRPDVVLHGRMRRQRETAEGLVAGSAMAGGRTEAWEPELLVDPGWDEFDHLGVVAAHQVDGAPVPRSDRRAFQRLFTEAVGRWSSGEHEGYAETYVDFLGRVAGALDRACARAGPGGSVLVSSSGGPIAAAVASLLAPEEAPAAQRALWLRLNTVIVNASYSRVVVGAEGPRLLTFNEHPHLGPELLSYR